MIMNFVWNLERFYIHLSKFSIETFNRKILRGSLFMKNFE